MRSSRRSLRAFSLLEVMVAIAILGLALSVILGAQGGLAASNRTAANMGTASALARCKMTELEEKLLREGYTELEVTDTEVSCCDTLDRDGFKCDIKIEKVVLPDAQSGGDGGAGLLGGALGGVPGSSGGATPGGLGGGQPGQPGPIDQLLNGGLDAGPGGIQALGSQLAGGGGADGLVSMAMGFVYPSLKIMLEASIRRVTVAVRWKEGPKARDMTIVQFVTNPQRGGLMGSALALDAGAPATGGPTTTPAGAGGSLGGGGAVPGLGAGGGGTRTP